MPYSENTKKSTYHALAILIAAGVLLGVLATLQYSFFHDVMEEELEDKAEAELTMKAIVTKNILSTMEKTLVGHIWDMKRELHHPDSMFNIARWIVKANPAILGCGFTFRPNYYPEKGRLFEPFAQRVDDKIITRQLASPEHDYTKEGSYPAALKAHKIVGDKIGYYRGLWLEPYFDNVTKKNTISYTTPIWDKDSCFVGVFELDASLELLGDTLNRRHLYPSSYDLLLSQKGKLLAAPPASKVSEERVMNVVRVINSGMKEKTHDQGRCTNVAYFEDIDGRDAIVFCAPFKGQPEWKVAVVCYEDEVFGDLEKIRLKTMSFSVIGLLLLSFILYLAMRNIFKLQEASVETEIINRELHIASNIQHEMLPTKDADIHRDDWDIACSLVSAKQVGGDLYDYFVRDEKLFFCIGDVSGKGVPSAIVMAVIHSLFRMASSRENNPARIMQTINEVSCQNNKSNMFVTIFIGVLDLPTGQFCYCNAGHDAPLIVGRDSMDVKPNLPVGVFSDYNYEDQQTILSSGETLFLYTDGLTEAMNLQHKLFGLSRVKEVINGCNGYLPQQLLDKMSEQVSAFTKGAGQSDDLTMMAIRYNAVRR